MKKNIFVISDVELGQGDLFDDFKDEKILIRFLKKITAEKGKNILIFNGDTFDFLKMHYEGKFTHHITEDISIWKMKRIIETYPRVFQALREFLNKSANEIHFNIGNHDYDLHWPAVQKLLQITLEHPRKISFASYYDTRDVHIEHGNQVDYFYKFEVEKPFLKHRGQTLLNLPFGNVAVTRYFIELKGLFPIEEKYPRHQAFDNFPEFSKRKQQIAWNFVIKGIILNFILSIGDPIASVPYLNLIKHIFIHGLEIHDESKFVKKRFKNLRKLYPGRRAYLMGHLHLTHHEVHPVDKSIQIVTDTWREEFDLGKNKERLLKVKTYAQISFENDKLEKVDLLTFS
jgi:UDP-2,3-diacylglucosamine pyrophosphatase LpxH